MEYDHRGSNSGHKKAEKVFRKITILYGLTLTEPEDDAIGLLAGNCRLFDCYGRPGRSEHRFRAPLAAFGIQQGIALCANDFDAEVKATFKFVKENLAEHKKDK